MSVESPPPAQSPSLNASSRIRVVQQEEYSRLSHILPYRNAVTNMNGERNSGRSTKLDIDLKDWYTERESPLGEIPGDSMLIGIEREGD